jgi:hypothetical protein
MALLAGEVELRRVVFELDRKHPPDRRVGGAGGEEPGHGPRGRQLPGTALDPGPRREVPALFDTVLSDAGIEVVPSGIRMPRMNSIMERSVQTCRRELLDRTLIWNRPHLRHALSEFEQFHNGHRTHQGIANARPMHPSPAQAVDPNTLTRPDIRRRDPLGGVLHTYQHAT